MAVSEGPVVRAIATARIKQLQAHGRNVVVENAVDQQCQQGLPQKIETLSARLHQLCL